MNDQKLIDKAVKIHKQLIENAGKDPALIDLALERRASKLHHFFYEKVPARIFHKYVKAVHESTGRPNWLAGRQGVPYGFCPDDRLP
jgi:hypothetical protein